MNQPPPGYGPPQGGYGAPPPGYGPPPGGYGPPPGGFGQPPGGFAPPPPQKKGMSGAAIALIILGVLVVLGGGSCAMCVCLGAAATSGPGKGPSRGSDAPSGPAMTVQAADLISAYKSNEISADNKYKGRLVNVAGGTVADVKKDLLDKPYVAIGTGALFEFPQIQCHLRQDQVNKAASLSKGRKIAVRGTVRGLIGHVQVHDCTIVSM